MINVASYEILNELDIGLIGYCGNSAIWQLKSHLDFLFIDGSIVRVPDGFETDLASVPRLPFIYPMWGDRVHREAVLHDYLYRKNSIPNVKRAFADYYFKEFMKIRNPYYIYQPIYAAVRLFAFNSYHKLNVEYKFSMKDNYVSC